jgi:hypothetical protein
MLCGKAVMAGHHQIAFVFKAAHHGFYFFSFSFFYKSELQILIV